MHGNLTSGCKNLKKYRLEKMSSYDVVISFDTTGSMSQCICEVRKKVKEVISRLFKEIPGIKIGIVAHGDYCDEKDNYLMKYVDIGSSESQIIDFIQNVSNTNGGDYPEAYEYVLREVQKLSWTSDSMRALVMIGDAYPHPKETNPEKIDWKEQVEEIKNMGINIYSIQALDSGNAVSYTFYKQMASTTNGYHLQLGQFYTICDMLLAICFNQMGSNRLEEYEQEIKKSEYGMNIGLRKMFDVLLKRTSTATKSYSLNAITTEREADSSKSTNPTDITELKACPMAKYQVLNVSSNSSIKDFVLGQGLRFKTGKGFYEFTKPETIGINKEVVLMKKETGELFEGSVARRIIGLSDVEKKYKPTDVRDYRVFIQSTSYNRKLVAGTGFLYEAEDFGRE